MLPVSVGSKRGFCNGKLDDLLPTITDITYSSQTPMGRHFLFHLQPSDEDKAWLQSTKEVFDGATEEIKAFDINLFPYGKPVLADVHQKGVDDCNAMSVLADMAFLYPEFIKSIIHKEAADSFRVDMYDPEGNPIVVCVSNRFPVREGGYPIFCVGEHDNYNWISIMEKAAMKWIKVYNHINVISGCNAEMITPMFTGDGRSFCIQPGRLESKDLSRMVNTCLEHGMMVNGGFLKSDIPLDGHKTIAKHGHSFLPPQRKGALYAIRNPWGGGANDHIMNVMSDNTVVPPLIDIRVISPGAAAQFFDKKAIREKIQSTKDASEENLYSSNWRNIETGEWEIGFFDDFAIYDCQFWNYKLKQQQGDKYSFILENNGNEVTVNVGNLKHGLRNISIDGKKGEYEVIISNTLPDYPSKDKRKGLLDNGYDPTDSVTIVGWLKDMPDWAWQRSREFSVASDDFFKTREEAEYAKMDSLGRFCFKMSLLNSSQVFVDWDRANVSSVLEPGKTYFFFDDFKTGQKLWMGDDVRLQNELLSYPHSWDQVRINYSEEVKIDAMVHWAQADSIRNKQTEELRQLLAAHPNLSERYVDYVKGYHQNLQFESMMSAGFYTTLPQDYMDYVTQELWLKALKPYTLYRDFVDRKTFYLNQLKGNSEDNDIVAALKRYEQEGRLTLSEEEKNLVSQYQTELKQVLAELKAAQTNEDRQRIANQFNESPLVKNVSVVVQKHMDLLKTHSYQRYLQCMDSVGTDRQLRDLCFACLLYDQIDGSRSALDPEVLSYGKENIQIPSAIAAVETLNDKYLAIQNRDIPKPSSLKSAEDVANMSDGEQILRKLIEPYKGKIILLDIWGTWCAPCKAALKHSQEEYERLKDYDLVYLYLANKSPDEGWKNVIKEYNVTGENVVHYNLPREQQSAIEHFININGYPTYKLIDRDGNVLDVNADPRDLEGLARLLDQMK
jgi:thiol-disulfide isomerase/thioredoxin